MNDFDDDDVDADNRCYMQRLHVELAQYDDDLDLPPGVIQSATCGRTSCLRGRQFEIADLS